MAYNEQLHVRLQQAIAGYAGVEEKYMFGGVCFMLNGKMCVGIVQDELMCRIGAQASQQALEQPGCREMVFTGKPMKDYVYVSGEAIKTQQQFDYWVGLCVAFNKTAKAAKKKK
jgi:TfoX/Sxy family transcriptional regulator of competence genes